MVLKYGLLAVAYLLGSIPFSVLFGVKIKGIDVRKHGSGNPGGTNSLRFLGVRVGILVLLFDGLKGGLIVLLIQQGVIDPNLVLHPLAYGVAAAFGHVFSIFIKFKGGKAVACTVGMMIAYNLLFALIMFLVFMITLKLFKYVSISSVLSTFSALIIAIIFNDWSMFFYIIPLFLLVFYRHIGNFKRIRNKEEPKVSWM